MTIYLGQLGRMVELYSTPSAEVESDEIHSFRTTLEGRVKGQVRAARGRRTWKLAAEGATPREQGALMSFTNGEWGNGPFVFVSADAPVTNMLTPAAASCAPDEFIAGSGAVITPAGPMLTPDGWAGRSFLKNTANSLFFGVDFVPVIPGVRVTASAYVVGAGGAVRLTWYDAAGSVLTTVTSSAASTAGTVVRSHITALPPAAAVSCRASTTSGVTQACRPAITWTDSLFDWAAGEGCPKAVIHAMSKDVTLASREPNGGRYGSLSYTVTEVG